MNPKSAIPNPKSKIPNFLWVLALTLALLAGLAAPAARAASGTLPGSGTQANPYRIEDRADFDAFCADSTKWAAGVYTRLDSNIDLAGTTYTNALIAPDMDPGTSDFDGPMFAGSFDGNGRVIRNLGISSSGNLIGLFGCIAAGGTVQKLKVENTSISGASSVGGVAGRNEGTIQYCVRSGNVSGSTEDIGGVAGRNMGTIQHCLSTGMVTGNNANFVGGVSGRSANSAIMKYCVNTSYISVKYISYPSPSGAGGITGACNSAQYCVNYGEVSAQADGGGVIGTGGGVIANCFNYGNINSYYTQGGIVAAVQNATINNCMNFANVSGIHSSGGVVGSFWYNSNVRNCASYGNVSASRNNAGGVSGTASSSGMANCFTTGAVSGPEAGGVAGYLYFPLSNCYSGWLIDSSDRYG